MNFSHYPPKVMPAHLYALRYAVPYLLHWVAGDSQFDAFLDPASTPPGATLTADTSCG